MITFGDTVGSVTIPVDKHGMPYDFQFASDCNMLLNAIRDITDRTNMTFYIEEPTLGKFPRQLIYLLD